MASSFLSLPTEVRIEVYRCLLCHHSIIQPQRLRTPAYWSGINRAKRALSGFRGKAQKSFLPESAILRTCRTVYFEALPVLYGENTFLYSCTTSIFNNEDYPKIGFPDVNLQNMQHLVLEVQQEPLYEEIAAESVAATIQYFIKRGCKLRTFRLSLFEQTQSDEQIDSDDDRYQLLEDIIVSLEVMTALVELEVSKTLTLFLSHSQKDSACNHWPQNSLGNIFQVFANVLASQKEMTASKMVKVFQDYDSYGEHDGHVIQTSYKLS